MAIFYPPVNVLELEPQHSSGAPGKHYPLCPNDFADFLPGELHDMRRLFEPDGAKFGPNDFVFYNPKRNVVIAAAPPVTIHFIKTILDSYNQGFTDPIQNLLLEGTITVGDNANSNPQLEFRIYSKSGVKSSASSLGGSGIGYQMEMETTNQANGDSCECSLMLKAFYGGKEYSLLTTFALRFGNAQTLLLGTTAQGERVEFRLIVKDVYFEPESPLRDIKWKERLLRRLRSARQSAPR
ncbi:MAG: hypothetical protein ACAI37_23570 [Chthoniobacter sp.]